MIEKFLIILIIGLIIISMVLAYNIYVENQYRKKIYKQFGNSNNDALFDGNPVQVRDGHGFNITNLQQDNDNIDNIEEDEKINQDISSIKKDLNDLNKDLNFDDKPQKRSSFFDGDNFLLNLNDLEKIELPWFNKKFDYMAYIALKSPKELISVPRFITKHRFTIVGCTMDDKFQIAQSIPGVMYKGFVVGLQSISRSGLTTSLELQNFGEKVDEFAKKMGGKLLLTDIGKFLKVAKVLDILCEKVDQIITLHLVSHNNYISGLELKNVLEKNEFELSSDGAFYYPNAEDGIFRIINLDEDPFTYELLQIKQYKGFSMLFDITHVPPGEKYFNKFMELAIKLSSSLDLSLQDDNAEQLSAQWLKNIGSYVLERQEEMKSVGIIPGRELANRIFK